MYMKTPLCYVLGLAIISAASLLVSCDDKAERGRHVFQEQCSGCHNADSTDRKVGPGLKGLFQHRTLTTNGKKLSDATVRARINEGGSEMPSFDQLLSDDDKESLIAFLKTL
jgi:cytochrome c